MYLLNQVIYYHALLQNDDKLTEEEAKSLGNDILTKADQLLVTVRESYLRSFILNIKGKTKLKLAGRESLHNR